jgi:hypothetical protein
VRDAGDDVPDVLGAPSGEAADVGVLDGVGGGAPLEEARGDLDVRGGFFGGVEPVVREGGSSAMGGGPVSVRVISMSSLVRSVTGTS